MSVFIAMLRGINVTGHGIIKMDALREMCVGLKLRDVRTHIQSGNVIFRTAPTEEAALAKKIQAGIEKAFGLRPEVILRSTREVRAVVEANPFTGRANIEPGKLLVLFLGVRPSAEVRSKIEALRPDPEELHLIGRELYIYFPDGQGRSKFVPVLDRILKSTGTGRNWNSVTKMLAIAEELEG